MIGIEEFKKLDLRIARIKEVLDHPQADKLYILQLDLGELGTKQVVAGIKPFYQKEELVGKQVVVVNNLQPVLLRGVESQGMILAATDDNQVVIISPMKQVCNGSIVK